MLRVIPVLLLLSFSSSCLLTDEFGVQPVNSVRSEEIPAEVALRTANGWRTGLGFFESDKRQTVVNKDFRENLYALAYAAGNYAMDDELKDGDFFTRESYENCLEQAFSGAAGAALFKFYNVQYGVAINDSPDLPDSEMLLSAWLAGANGASACRTALIKTGRVFEIGVLRF